MKSIRAIGFMMALACLSGQSYAMTFRLTLGPKVGSGPTTYLGTYSSYKECRDEQIRYKNNNVIPPNMTVWCS
jgi:hypothetical protein